MSVKPIEIIGADTAQVVSAPFSSEGPRTLCCSLLGDGEGVKIQFTHDGVVWQDLWLNGVLQEIIPKHTMMTLLGPGLFRCIKSVTVAPVSVVSWWSENDA